MLRFIFTMLTIPLLVLTSIAQKEELSQYKKWFAGGNFNMDYNTGEDETSNGMVQRKGISVRISPSAGFQINRHWLIGISPVYEYDHNYREDPMQVSNKSISHQYGAGIFARYLYSWCPQWHIYLQPYTHFLYAIRTNERSNLTTDHQNSSTVLSTGVLPGISYTTKKRIRIFASFGRISIQHRFGKNRENYQRKSTQFDLDLGLSSLYLGIEYLF